MMAKNLQEPLRLPPQAIAIVPRTCLLPHQVIDGFLLLDTANSPKTERNSTSDRYESNRYGDVLGVRTQ